MRTLAVAALIVPILACKKPPEVKQHWDITADEKGFTPSSVRVQKGAPATLTFTRTSDHTCAKDVVFPALQVKKPLPLHQPVELEVPTDSERTLAFTCGMGMFESSVVVQ